MKRFNITRIAIAAGLAGVGISLAGPATSQTKVERGKYLAAIMDCGGCHTPGVFLGKPDMARYLAGSEVGFQLPGLGTFFPPNLTPDPETGLGKWSEADIIKAVRTGERPDGRVLAPVMPYHSYAAMNDADAAALAAFLKSNKPIRNQVPAMTGPSVKPNGPFLAVTMP